MTDYKEHLITPPPGLIEQWRDEALNSFPDDENPCPCDVDDARDEHIAIQAANWGADLELKACTEWVYQTFTCGRQWAEDLRSSRRPKPPSLKEKALAILSQPEWSADEEEIIRKALEALPDG